MALVGPISDDEWDSWEPLVGGLPICLRIILFCHLLLVIPLFIVVVTAAGRYLAFAGRLLGALLFVWHVASLLRVYRLSRWALISLAAADFLFGVGLFVAAIVYAFDWGVPAGILGILLFAGLGLCFFEVAFYLLRLEAWVRRHPRRQATGGTDSPKACRLGWGRQMAVVGPISDDEWDRWEPLVAGLPFCLRIIVFHQYFMAMLAPFFIWPSVLAPLLVTWGGLALLSLVVVSVWYFVSVLGAYRLSRWALISLALINLFFSLCCFGGLLLDSLEFGELAEPALIFVVVFLGVFPLLEGLYLLRLEAWVRRHPRRQATGGTDSPKACP